LLIHFCDECLVITVTCQGLAKCENMLRPVVALQRLRDDLPTALYARMTQLCQCDRISLACEDRIHDAKPAEASDVAQHSMYLQIHLVQGLLHMHHVLGGHLDQTIPVSPE